MLSFQEQKLLMFVHLLFKHYQDKYIFGAKKRFRSNHNSFCFLQYISYFSKAPFTPESRSTPAVSRSGKMDGSAMSGPWSGRAYVGLRYSGDCSEMLWWAGKFFQPVEKWLGMTLLSTNCRLSGDTAWWSAIQRRLVISWSGMVGDI